MAKTSVESTQLPLPGVPRRESAPEASLLDARELVTGRAVRYTDHIPGGPRYGTCGVVKRTFARRALAELSGFGNRTIPYYFLGPNGQITVRGPGNENESSKVPVTQ